MAANIDDHNKNFSFIMNREGSWRLAPAYDFTFTVDPSAPSYVNRHSMTVKGKNHDVSADDLLELAASFDVKGAPEILKIARSAVENFAAHAEAAGLSPEITALIEQAF